MTIREWAGLLNGREYGEEVTREEERCANDDGIVITFGCFDDLIEFHGAIHEEFGSWDGQIAYVTPDGLVILEPDECGNVCHNCPLVAKEKARARKIEAIWAPKDDMGEVYASWLIKTDIPHETFDIMKDSKLFCRGIVFALADLKEQKP